MNKLDELNERLARLEERKEAILRAHEDEIKEINDEISNISEVLALLTSFLSDINESFATLCVSHSTGGVTIADLTTFADVVGLEVPDELKAEEEAGEADTGDPNITAQAS